MNVSSYFTDPDGDALTYTASSGNAAVASATATGATLTITGRGPGSTTVTVTARDPGGLTATQTVSVTVSKATAADLLFSAVRPTNATAAPGSSVTLFFTIQNAGDANSAATAARGYQSTDATITTSDRVITQNDIPVQGLVPGGMYRMTLTLGIPATLPAGDYYFGMCVDPVTGESNANNNCSSAVTLTVAVPRPDLAVTDVDEPSLQIAAGSNKTVTFTVENQGDADAGPADANFYESDDNTIATSDTQVGGPIIIPATPAGQLANPSPEGAIQPASARMPGSQYWYGMCIERAMGASGAADETNITNNCSPAVQVGVTRAGGPDLVVAGADPDAFSVRVGQSTDVVFTIQNVGDLPTTQFTSVEILRSGDNSITTADGRVHVFAVPVLNPLATFEFKWTVTGDANDVGVLYYLGICMETTGANGESTTADGGLRVNNNCSGPGAFASVFTTASSSSQQSDLKQPDPGRTAEPVRRAIPARVARPERNNSGSPPPGSFTMVLKSVEVRGSTGR